MPSNNGIVELYLPTDAYVKFDTSVNETNGFPCLAGTEELGIPSTASNIAIYGMAEGGTALINGIDGDISFGLGTTITLDIDSTTDDTASTPANIGFLRIYVADYAYVRFNTSCTSSNGQLLKPGINYVLSNGSNISMISKTMQQTAYITGSASV